MSNRPERTRPLHPLECPYSLLLLNDTVQWLTQGFFKRGIDHLLKVL